MVVSLLGILASDRMVATSPATHVPSFVVAREKGCSQPRSRPDHSRPIRCCSSKHQGAARLPAKGEYDVPRGPERNMVPEVPKPGPTWTDGAEIQRAALGVQKQPPD